MLPNREPLRLLITGANGFVGRHLVAGALAETETQVLAAVHRHSSPLVPDTLPMAGWRGDTAGGRVEIVEMDICDAAATKTGIARMRPHQIVHLAARASGADADREAVFEVNVNGTRNLLEAASLVSPFPRTLVVSTGYVYGSIEPSKPSLESDPLGPLWRFGPYVDSKIEMENVSRSYRGFALIARPFAHTGPGQPPYFALPSFARQLARIEQGLEPPRIKVGNLEALRDMLDVRDVVRAYLLLLQYGIPGDIVNIATGQPHSMRFYLDSLRQEASVATEVERDPARLRAADIACSSGDATYLTQLTGWTPRYSTQATLRDMLAYWRQKVSAER